MQQRYDYLRKIRNYREQRYEIVYTDESWLNQNCYCPNAWSHNHEKGPTKEIIKDCDKCDIYHPSGKGKRCILVDAGSAETGFIPNSGEALITGGDTADYHDDMNGARYQKWFDKLLANLQTDKKYCIIIDRASYHNELTDDTKVPHSNARKAELIEWCKEKKIPLTGKERVVDLRLKIKRNKPKPVFLTDQKAERLGHVCLRTPVKHCELNAIELVWGDLKENVREKNTDYNIKKVKDIWLNEREQYGKEKWKKCVDHVLKVGPLIKY